MIRATVIGGSSRAFEKVEVDTLNIQVFNGVCSFVSGSAVSTLNFGEFGRFENRDMRVMHTQSRTSASMMEAVSLCSLSI
jgi:hypothetical protein